MRRRRPASAAVLAAVLALSACTADAGPGGGQLSAIEQGSDGLVPAVDRVPAPVLSGRTLDGDELDVSALTGEVVVVNVWASWCAPCRAEAETLRAVSQQTADDGVVFVGLNVRDEPRDARAFERSYDVPYASILDQPGALLTCLRRLVPQTPPSTLLLDREGRIAARFIGGVTEAELLMPVLQLAAE